MEALIEPTHEPISERQRLAEEWRRTGKMLQEISPELFAKLLVMFASSALEAEHEDPIDICNAYTAH